MKKIIFLILISIFIFSCGVLAENKVEFYPSLIEDDNLSENIPGGIIRIENEYFGEDDFKNQLEINTSFGLKESNYHFVDIDLLFYNRVTDISQDTFVGLGGKYLFLDNSTELNNTTDITAYMLPIVFKTEDRITQRLSLSLDATYIPLGFYNILVPGDDIMAGSSGYGFRLAGGYKLSNNLRFKLGYLQNNYNFKKDDGHSFSKKFDKKFQGVYLGGEYSW